MLNGMLTPPIRGNGGGLWYRHPIWGWRDSASDSLTFDGSTLSIPGSLSLSSTLTATQFISTVSTGTAPLSVASTTVVPNLNVSQLLGSTWAVPGAIGSTTPNTGAFTTLSASSPLTVTDSTASSSTTTGALVVTGGAGIGGAMNVGGNITMNAGNTSNRLILGNSTAVSDAHARFLAGSTHYGWLFGAQFNVNNAFEITPSTAVGGTTFTTPAFQIDGATGNSTFSGTLTVNGGNYSAFVQSGGSAQIRLERTSSSTGFAYIGSDSDGFVLFVGGTSTKHMVVSSAGSVVCGGQSALATNATGGFLYIPSCAGTPTGTPTSYTGKIPLVYDSTNNFLYVYNGGWKKSTVYA